MHKLFGRGDLYCWNCGGRQHVGKKRCPHCGAYYNNSSKPVIKRAKAHPGLGPLHYTVVSYIVKYISKDAVEQITKSVFGALAAFAVLSATMMLTACDPHWANAQRHIEWALNPDDGSWLTTDQIIDKFSSDNATRSDKIWGRDCIIELPLTNADIRPQEGVNYVGMGSGTTMLFQFSENADTLCHTIGKVDINWREDRWGFDVSEDEIRLNPNRFGSKTYFVESRGKSVYTLYEYEERTDTLGNPIADSLGNVQADIRRLGMLLFVYPGADSILIHRGSKETQRTFKIN